MYDPWNKYILLSQTNNPTATYGSKWGPWKTFVIKGTTRYKIQK